MSKSQKHYGKQLNRDTVRLDFAKIEELIQRTNRTFAQMADAGFADVSRTKWYEIKKGEKPTDRSLAIRVAKAFNKELSEILYSDDDDDRGQIAWPAHPEWEYVEQDVRWEHTSNGLYFFRSKVRHKHIGDSKNPHFAQARVYDLTRVPDRRREEMRELLTRHAMVCRQLAAHPQFVKNVSVAPVADGSVWWVVDEWLDGRTLREIIAEGAVKPHRLLAIMRQVAGGLDILHRQKIVVRELSPRRLLMDDRDCIRFLELDLAKLLFRDKTVSAEWIDDDPYRAPEVDGGQVTPKADLFSWAMIYLHASTGDTTLRWRDAGDAKSIPTKLMSIVAKCLSPSPRSRPGSIETVLKALSSTSVK